MLAKKPYPGEQIDTNAKNVNRSFTSDFKSEYN